MDFSHDLRVLEYRSTHNSRAFKIVGFLRSDRVFTVVVNQMQAATIAMHCADSSLKQENAAFPRDVLHIKPIALVCDGEGQ